MTLKYIQDRYSPGMIKGMNRAGIYKMFFLLGFKTGCEVGVHAAKNALVIFQSIPGVKLYLVEPYADHECSIAKWGEYNKNNVSSHANARKTAHEILKNYNTEWLEMFSEDAASKIENNSLDFVYIDAEHFYDFAMLDIILWTRKIKIGGIVSGHDYDYWEPDKPKVARAVNDYTSVHGIDLYYTSKIDRRPSWFFVKS